jgi:hypothetical protein
MINIWIIADVVISMVSMPALVFQYYMDKKFYENQWIELVVHTQNNALKKFYQTDETAKSKEEDRTIINRLTKRIFDKQEAAIKK